MILFDNRHIALHTQAVRFNTQYKLMHTTKNKIIVISGPSGAGKTTLLNRLFLKKRVRSNFVRSISYTTRPRRAGEHRKKDYFFIHTEEFRRLIKKEFFLEYQKVLNSYYGTPKYFIQEAKRTHKGLILCIDVKGGMYLKNNLKRYKIVTIFISAPTTQELSQRLRKRGDASVAQERMALAKKELLFVKDYDYLIINQEIKESLRLLEAILTAESLRRN